MARQPPYFPGVSALETTPTIPSTRAYWTSAELAERFGVDLDTIYELAATAGLPHIRLGRAYRFGIDAVLEWERRRTIESNGSAPNRPLPKPAKPARRPPKQAFAPQPYTGPLRAA